MSRVSTYLKRQRATWLLEDFWRFSTVTNILDKIDKQPHEEMLAKMFEAVPDFKGKRQHRMLYLAPRYTYKSTIAICLIVYMILRFPEISIVVYRATSEKAKQMLENIQQILTTNPEILETFGDLSKDAPKWTTQQITVNTRKSKRVDPTLTVSGLRSSMAGAHPDFVLLDDIVTEINCDSPGEMEKAFGLLTSIYPLLPPWGSVLVTGTRWSDIDAYGQIERINRELMDADKPPDYETYIRKATWRDEHGELKFFFPRELTEDFLDRQKQTISARWYASFYYNETHEEGLHAFPREKIKLFDGELSTNPYHVLTVEDKEIPVYVAIVVDPALTASTDFYGIVVIAWDAEQNWWVLEAQEWRKLPSAAGDEIVRLLAKYEPSTILVESSAADAEMMARIGRWIRDALMDTGVRSYSALQDELPGKRGKSQRIESLEPLFRQNKIKLRRGLCGRLLNQLDAYPTLAHDDVIDALAMGRKLAKLAPSMAQRMVAPDDREPVDRFHETLDQMEIGPRGARKAMVPRGAWTGPLS